MPRQLKRTGRRTRLSRKCQNYSSSTLTQDHSGSSPSAVSKTLMMRKPFDRSLPSISQALAVHSVVRTSYLLPDYDLAAAVDGTPNDLYFSTGDTRAANST